MNSDQNEIIIRLLQWKDVEANLGFSRRGMASEVLENILEGQESLEGMDLQFERQKLS